MVDAIEDRTVLGEPAARQLATITKTAPQWLGITPRWLVALLPWVPVEAGAYRVNRVVDSRNAGDDGVECSPSDQTDLPETYVDYDVNPRQYTLNAVTTVVDVQTRVSDLFSSPHDQIREQLRLTIERVKERQEHELINNEEYGLLQQPVASMRIPTRTGPPTPDDLDELIAKVWKHPSFFLAHPRAVAAIGRECTRRGVPPATVNLFGSQFLTWRGLPIIPCDKLEVADDDTTNVLLLRTGAEKQGVVGLFQPGVPGEVTPSLSVRFMGIDRRAIASYLVSLYCSAAVHTEDALGVLENVQVGHYHEYA
jgi:Phage capsid-like protein